MSKDDKKTKAPQFVPDPDITSKRVYANFASVRSTGLDFTVSFADVLPPTKEQVTKAEKGEPISVPLQCEIVMPNDLVPALINALQEQYGRYQEKIKSTTGSKDTKENRKQSNKN